MEKEGVPPLPSRGGKEETAVTTKQGIPMDSWSPMLAVLFAVFGLGAWLEIVGIWAEMFLLIQHTPEQEKLPSRLAFIVQVSALFSS